MTHLDRRACGHRKRVCHCSDCNLHLQTSYTQVMATLRRFNFAQEKLAKSTSPVKPTPHTPVRGQAGPSTPRKGLVYTQSPYITPSRSASTPFDWEAARARRPPPYGTPLAGRRVQSSPTKSAPARKERVVRKKGLIQKCVASLVIASICLMRL